MARRGYPITPAVRFLRSKQVTFQPYLYRYASHGGARQAALALDISAHQVVKTLVMETEDPSPLLVLMHGDLAVSTRKLARFIGTKKVTPVTPAGALRHTGYQVGGISPFGTRSDMPVYVQDTILESKTIFINGGRRGFMVEIEAAVLLKTLPAMPVDVANER